MPTLTVSAFRGLHTHLLEAVVRRLEQRKERAEQPGQPHPRWLLYVTKPRVRCG